MVFLLLNACIKANFTASYPLSLPKINTSMKSTLFFILSAFALVAFAQKPCCTATQQFADLGKKTGFQNEHQLPGQILAIDQTGKWVEFDTPDEKGGRGYTIYAENATNKFLFVFHEWWGLNDNIIRESEEWAELFPNVTVIAIDLYDGKVATTREAAAEFMQSADETRIRSIIQGAMEWAGDGAEMATIGWCFGGGWSMQAALMASESAIGCVIYYGMPENDPEKLDALNCKVLGIFAEQDKWINREVVGKYEKAMNESDKAYETFWFDAAHAFANPSNPVFDEEAAGAARKRTIAYFRQVF
jgi:carboxymethylenebutenolidase